MSNTMENIKVYTFDGRICAEQVYFNVYVDEDSDNCSTFTNENDAISFAKANGVYDSDHVITDYSMVFISDARL